MKVRASLGTANRLGLEKGENAVEPTTAYLLLERGCSGKCSFCPQSKGHRSKVSRMEWPEFEASAVADLLKSDGRFERICVQTSIYPKLEEDLAGLLGMLEGATPVTVSISPLTNIPPYKLERAGAERVGVPVDGASASVMTRSKGIGEKGWDRHFDYMFDAIGAFGQEKVSTHIIVGLGETERELAVSLRSFRSIGVKPGLFALTPFKGSGLKAPTLKRYRRAQLMAMLLDDLDLPLSTLAFDARGSLAGLRMGRDAVMRELQRGKAFMTRGCPGCNRPFYNETVNGPWYNFPRPPSCEEAAKAAGEAVEGLEFDA